MNLDRVNELVNDAKNNKFVQNFIKELQNYIEKSSHTNNFEKGDLGLVSSIEDKLITKYRDKFKIERSDILNNYSKETPNQGEMFYIYSLNSKLENSYNLCICKEGQIHTVIEVNKNELPEDATVGSVLRKNGENYILDNNATEEIARKLNNMEDALLEEQAQFLESKRIEGHIYELSEKNSDRVWLFDITDSNALNTEAVEEIEFPKELLKNTKEGDKFVYKNGEYQRKFN